jgi:hypothetical protein
LYEVGAISGAEYESRSKDLDAKKVSIDEEILKQAADQYESIEDLRKWIKDNVGKYIELSGQDVSVGSGISEKRKDYTERMENFLNSDYWFNQWAQHNDESKTGLSNEEYVKRWTDSFRELYIKAMEEGKYGSLDEIFRRGGYAKGISSVPYDNFPAFLHKDEGVIPGDFMSAINSGELVLSGSKGGAGSTVNNYYSINVEGTVVTERELIEKVNKKTGTMMRRGYVS